MARLYAKAKDGKYDLDAIHTDQTMFSASERDSASADLLINPRPGQVALRDGKIVDAILGDGGKAVVEDGA